MCRRNLIPAMALLGFGAGLLAGCCIGSCVVSFCLAAGAIGAGICLMKRR